jgi:hypothetical protein
MLKQPCTRLVPAKWEKTTWMVAEKACDLILGNTMEAPSSAGFYQHQG